MPFSSVINRAYLLILILKKIMCIYIYIYIYINYLKKKKQMHKWHMHTSFMMTAIKWGCWYWAK